MDNLRTFPPGKVVAFRGGHAGRTPRPKRRDLPLGPALMPTIQRLKEIAMLSGDHLVTEGSVHPDHALLDLCAAALHLMKQADQAQDIGKSMFASERILTAAERTYCDAADDQGCNLRMMAGQLLRRARMLPARTEAGIYAKALLVAGSQSGAATLAQSLASDLIACHAFRRSLGWPEGQGEARP
jgi:hypothetical protein